MHFSYIDIHTHHPIKEPQVFKLPNVIFGKENVLKSSCSIGIHPWYLPEQLDNSLAALYSEAAQSDVLAIGECGLDKVCDTEWSLQVYVFEKQIQLANDLQKPLIIHCVRAYQEIMQILKEKKVNVPVIFHGFNKKYELGDSILKKGYYLSLGKSILNGTQDELIQKADVTKIFLETDDKSTNIVDIYTYFCAARKISLEQLQNQLFQNFINVFRYRIEE